MSVKDFDWWDASDRVATSVRDILLNGVARTNTGKHRGRRLSDGEERVASLRQVDYLGTHRGVA